MPQTPDILPIAPTSEEQPHKPDSAFDKAADSASQDAKSSTKETSEDASSDDRKIGFARSTDGGDLNARDPKSTVKDDEDHGEPANPAEHADIAGE